MHHLLWQTGRKTLSLRHHAKVADAKAEMHIFLFFFVATIMVEK